MALLPLQEDLNHQIKNKKMKILAVTFLTNQNRNDRDLSLIKNGNIDVTNKLHIFD